MDQGLTRREILAGGTVLGVGLSGAMAADTQPAGALSIESLPLGKTGAKVTRLGIGASFPEYGERVLNYAYRCGIRYFDNSESYYRGKCQRSVGEWVKNQSLRKELFLVTKTHATDPDHVYQNALKSCQEMQVDTIDLFMLHGIENPDLPLDKGGEWRKLKDRLIRENKIRFMGFSTHAEMPKRSACLTNAPKGGWVDALMVASDPGTIKANPALDKALDVCAQAGIGLVCMKTTRGLGKAQEQPESAVEAFKALGLTPHAAMLTGMWSDGRFASVCSEMPNFKIIDENSATARSYRKPLDEGQRKTLQEGILKLSRATCPGCDGSCRLAAGSKTDFCSIARYVAYHDHDGKREMARELYAALSPEERAWAEADLGAASGACHAHLDFDTILQRAAQVLG